MVPGLGTRSAAHSIIPCITGCSLQRLSGAHYTTHNGSPSCSHPRPTSRCRCARPCIYILYVHRTSISLLLLLYRTSLPRVCVRTCGDTADRAPSLGWLTGWLAGAQRGLMEGLVTHRRARPLSRQRCSRSGLAVPLRVTHPSSSSCVPNSLSLSLPRGE